MTGRVCWFVVRDDRCSFSKVKSDFHAKIW